jgi:predicted nicotinamide N-methyase
MSVSSSDDGEGMFGAMFLPDDEDIQDTFQFTYAVPPPAEAAAAAAAAGGGGGGGGGVEGGGASWAKVCITLEGLEQEYGQVSRRTGFTLWDAAGVLADWMVRAPSKGGGLGYIRGKRVVELGCGLGLCGILASYLSPIAVVVTDGDAQVCDKARDNAARNGCAVPVRQLRWGTGVEDFMRSALPQISTNDNGGGGGGGGGSSSKGVDGNHHQQQPYFDTVFGADIIYDADILDVLFSTVEMLLGGPLQKANGGQEGEQQQKSCRAPGVFVVGYRRRTVSQPLIFEAAERHGFTSSDVESLGELFVFVQVARAATEGEKGKEKEVSVQHEKKKEVYSS